MHKIDERSAKDRFRRVFCVKPRKTAGEQLAGEGRHLTDSKQLGKLFLSNANARVDDLTGAPRRKRDHWI